MRRLYEGGLFSRKYGSLTVFNTLVSGSHTIDNRLHNNIYIIQCRGESKTVQREKVTASSWMANKIVTVMSTTSQPSATGTVLRRQKDGTRLSVPCPEAILTYNQYMGGVDRGDQLRGYYSCKVKSRKFYKYIFYFLLDVSM